MTVLQRSLEIDIYSYWHAGTGRGGGEDADALVERDGDGLPYLPARHVKGLLRDACLRLERWGALSNGTTDLMFGTDPAELCELDMIAEVGPEGLSRHETRPGCLAIGSAMLPPALRSALKGPPEHERLQSSAAQLRRGLFAFVTSTAMDEATGVARTDSLRRVEVAVPLRLWAEMCWAPEERLVHAGLEERGRIESAGSAWPVACAQFLPLVRAVGAYRSRGYGRARLTLMEAAP